MNKLPELFLSIVICCSCFPLWAKDTGVILDQNATAGDYGNDDTMFEYSASLSPSFSDSLSANSGYYISAAFTAAYNTQKRAGEFVPELMRTEFFLNSGNMEFRFGRIPYSDPAGWITEGLFDGFRFFLDTDMGMLSLGAWYTGLLYKARNVITMTGKEQESYAAALDYGDFSDTYFAPRRFVSALGWEHPALGELVRAQFAFIGQADLSDQPKLHSQYLTGKITVPVTSFIFDLGGTVEFIEAAGTTKVALAGEAAAAWMPPTSFDDRLSLLGRFSGGTVKDSSVTAFVPIVTIAQGNILNAQFSGLSIIALDYLARLHNAVSAGFTVSCFVRNDLGTYKDYPVDVTGHNDGYVVGTELYWHLFWNPGTDWQFNLGSGVFVPSLGNVAPDAGNLWQLEISLVFVLY